DRAFARVPLDLVGLLLGGLRAARDLFARLGVLLGLLLGLDLAQDVGGAAVLLRCRAVVVVGLGFGIDFRGAMRNFEGGRDLLALRLVRRGLVFGGLGVDGRFDLRVRFL